MIKICPHPQISIFANLLKIKSLFLSYPQNFNLFGEQRIKKGVKEIKKDLQSVLFFNNRCGLSTRPFAKFFYCPKLTNKYQPVYYKMLLCEFPRLSNKVRTTYFYFTITTWGKGPQNLTSLSHGKKQWRDSKAIKKTVKRFQNLTSLWSSFIYPDRIPVCLL